MYILVYRDFISNILCILSTHLIKAIHFAHEIVKHALYCLTTICICIWVSTHGQMDGVNYYPYLDRTKTGLYTCIKPFFSKYFF